jgi:hypothetical protein
VDEVQVLEWIPPRRDGRRVQATHIAIDGAAGDTVGVLGSRPAWGWGLEHGVNAAGVAAGNATIYTTDDPRQHPPALTGMDLVRVALERAVTARQAVDVLTTALERYGQGGTGHHGRVHPYWSSFLIADAGSAWVVETSARAFAIEEVERTRAISNRTTISSFDAARRHPRQPVERLVDPRLQASRAALAEPVTLDAIERLLRSHDGVDGYSLCMHVPGVEQTNASMIAVLRPGSRPEVRVVEGSPCQEEYRIASTMMSWL